MGVPFSSRLSKAGVGKADAQRGLERVFERVDVRVSAESLVFDLVDERGLLPVVELVPNDAVVLVKDASRLKKGEQRLYSRRMLRLESPHRGA